MKKNKKTHYDRAAQEVIKAVRDAWTNYHPPFTEFNFRKGAKLVREMLKANFIPRKRKWL